MVGHITKIIKHTLPNTVHSQYLYEYYIKTPSLTFLVDSKTELEKLKIKNK